MAIAVGGGALGLVVAGFVLIGVMTVVVPLVTGLAPGLPGYVAVLAIYWTFYCVPVAALVLGGSGVRDVSSLRIRGAMWVPVVVLAQPAFYALTSLTDGLLGLSLGTYALAVALACVNAPLEELAWRGAYLRASGGNVLVQALGVWVFSLWHAPLLLANGITFGDFAPLTILGGSFLLGAFWAFLTWRTAAVGWPIVGHFLTNVVAFSLLVAANR